MAKDRNWISCIICKPPQTPIDQLSENLAKQKSRNSHSLKTTILLLKLFHKSWLKWAIKIPETNKFRLN